MITCSPLCNTPFACRTSRLGTSTINTPFGFQRNNENGFRRALAKRHVASSVFYPAASIAWPKDILGDRYHAPRAEKASNEVVSLPIHPRLAPEHQERVAGIVRSTVEC